MSGRRSTQHQGFAVQWALVGISLVLSCATEGGFESGKLGVGGKSLGAATGGSASVGVASCDNYLENSEYCFRSTLDRQALQKALRGLEEKRALWLELADSVSKRQALERACLLQARLAAREFSECRFE